ncbi:MAG: helicase, partial [Candidatus Hydrogenedentes bacterium]|nr:helicase [Candidatus Hydrogenedentota bacterium]
MGKTFVGMMLIERLAEFDRKRVALFVPKAARKPVWEAAINKYLPHLHGDFSNLVVYNHTDLSRGNDFIARFARLSEMADVIIIDEAHHFRNPGFVGSDDRRPSRYRQMFEIADGKTMYMLTATPVNNKLIDLQHMIELFSRRQSDYFKRTLGINSLAGHFRTMEKALERKLLPADAEVDGGMETNEVEAEEVLTGDHLFRGLVVQRSRAYVRRSQEQQDGFRAIFPEREAPQVAHYSVKKTYGKLLDIMEKAFSKDKPLFALPIYYPLAYYKGDDESIDTKLENRQKQVVGLIRVQFLKRFESSASAFKLSCVNLLGKLLAFVQKNCHTEHDQKHFERWKLQNADILGYAHEQTDLFEPDDDDDDDDSDLVTEELLEAAEQLSEKDYKVDEILQETYLDLSQIIEFLRELEKFKPKHDDKLNALIKLLKTDPVMKKHKVLIFTEYLHTARYLKKHLQDAGIDAVDEVDSKTDRDRGQIIRQFSPYYNDSSSAELEAKGLSETRILIATDVLSEGLNL